MNALVFLLHEKKRLAIILRTEEIETPKCSMIFGLMYVQHVSASWNVHYAFLYHIYVILDEQDLKYGDEFDNANRLGESLDYLKRWEWQC